MTPEEIERVDVLYGPFSAAYPGNSVGAVVDYVTRMPKAFEAHVKLQGFSRTSQVYGTDDRYTGAARAARRSGSRSGDLSWWLNVNRLDSDGQPIAFANKLVSAGTAGNAGTPVTGAVPDRNPRNRDWLILGATTQTHTVQDHAKLKLAYDISPALRASYTLRLLAQRGRSRGRRPTCATRPATRSTAARVNVDGRSYTLDRRRLRAEHGEPRAPDARAVRQEQHARRLGLGGGRERSTTTAATRCARRPSCCRPR